MAYKIHEFLNYLQNKHYANPNGYLYALDKIERDYSIDIDKEFEIDNCSSFCKRLQQKCIDLEKAGKTTNTEKTFLSRLKKYVIFRQEEITTDYSNDDKSELFLSLETYVDIYINSFWTRWDRAELKWNAAKKFLENWDIDSENFITMFNNSTNLSSFISLYNGFPKRTIIKLAQIDINNTKTLFKELYDETQPLENRCNSFYENINELSLKYNIPVFDRTLQVYLFLRFPEKYYLYKSRNILLLKKIVTKNSSIVQSGTQTQKMLENYRFLDKIKKYILCNSDFINDYVNFIHEQGYKDDGFCILISDFCEFVSEEYESENNDMMYYDNTNSEISNVVIQSNYSYTKQDFLNDVFMTSDEYDELVGLLEHKKNLILQGAPGVGKSYAAKRLAYSIIGSIDDERVQMVQFHQSYSYEDFIAGFRPNDNGGFYIQDGPFYTFCKNAEDDLYNKYFFIIDEINRGNLSKIFGELMLLLESDKRGNENSINLLYKNEPFSIPENVHIIGMMNTADRSLAMIDYALRRRFVFYTMEPAFEKDSFKVFTANYSAKNFDKVINVIIALNADIASDVALGKGFRIGHSYFCSNDIDDNKLLGIVKYEIVPQLYEYWFDDEAKAKDWERRLLGAIND